MQKSSTRNWDGTKITPAAHARTGVTRKPSRCRQREPLRRGGANHGEGFSAREYIALDEGRGQEFHLAPVVGAPQKPFGLLPEGLHLVIQFVGVAAAAPAENRGVGKVEVAIFFAQQFVLAALAPTWPTEAVARVAT